MKVFIMYTIIIVVTIFICMLTGGYKRKVFKNLDKKQHRLKFFYGVAAFLIDIANTYLHVIHYENIRIKLSRIYVKKADEMEAYLYMVSKVAISVLLFLIIGVTGYIKCAEVTFSGQKRIIYIERPENGEGERIYNLIADYKNGCHEKIEVILGERKLTEEEVMRMLSESYEELVTEFLGKNDSLDNITDSVNLISGMEDGIAVEWELTEQDYIDYSGNIRWENVTSHEDTEIKAILSVGDFSQCFILPLTLNKEEQNKSYLAYDELNTIIESFPEYEKKIELPDYLAGKQVQFYKEKEKGTLIYLIIAFAAAAIIFVAKEKETDKKLEQRRRQLETDYATIVNKLTILQGAGMTLLSAWDKIILDYDKDERKRYAYEEMKYARNKMKAGYSETASYLEFGRRCGIHSYIKFANLLEQNIKKGTKGLGNILNTEAREALEERKALARKKGDEAGTKLLFPMGIMLIISIVMIMVPALMTINV